MDGRPTGARCSRRSEAAARNHGARLFCSAGTHWQPTPPSRARCPCAQAHAAAGCQCGQRQLKSSLGSGTPRRPPETRPASARTVEPNPCGTPGRGALLLCLSLCRRCPGACERPTLFLPVSLATSCCCCCCCCYCCCCFCRSRRGSWLLACPNCGPLLLYSLLIIPSPFSRCPLPPISRSALIKPSKSIATPPACCLCSHYPLQYLFTLASLHCGPPTSHHSVLAYLQLGSMPGCRSVVSRPLARKGCTAMATRRG